MRAMILAAGLGKRMRPLTLNTPKPLLKIAGKPIISYIISGLAKADIKRLVINHAWLGEQLETELGDGSDFAVHIEYSAEPYPLETATGIARALPYLTADNQDSFLVVNGDIYSDYDFSKLPLILAPDKLAHLVLVDNPAHNLIGDFALDQQGQVALDADEKLTFSGISLLSKKLFEGLNTEQPAALAPLLKAAIVQGKVSAEHYQGVWFDIGTAERLTEIDKILRSKNVY